MSENNVGTLDYAAETYWKTDTTGKGHLQRGRAFHAAVNTLVEEGGFKKGEAQKMIAAEVVAQAPAHEKKFGSATVSHYNASFSLFEEESSNFAPTLTNADLYAAVHKAYAGSMGVEHLRNILATYPSTEEGREQALQAVTSLTRESKANGEEGEGERAPRTYGLKHALAALARIQEKEDWTEAEKGQLFEAALATSVAVQPDLSGSDDQE